METWDTAALRTASDDSTLRHRGSVHAVTTCRRQDGRMSFATASSDRTAGLWEPGLSLPPGRLLHPRAVHAVTAVQPDDRAQLLATAGHDGRIRIWDHADSRRIDPLRKPRAG